MPSWAWFTIFAAVVEVGVGVLLFWWWANHG